jgi:hypothetical protein
MVAVLALLAIPRIVRLAYPQVWIEDESYLNGAFMLARGWVPYRDFPLPHFPALEAMLAAVFLVAPITIRTAEIVTAAAGFAGSVLILLVGRALERQGDAPRHTAALAALVYATSALLFRYHVFEREVFVVPAVVGAMWLLVRGPDDDARSMPSIVAGLLFALAMAIKLTAVSALLAAVVFLVLRGRRRDAALVVAASVGPIALLTVILTAVVGTPFVVQVVLFRAVHATFPSLATKLDEMRYTLDVALAFGVTGVALLFWTGMWRRWMAPLLQLASGVILLVLVNPTYWAHTGIELLPWLALPAGCLLAWAASGAPAPAAVHPPPVQRGALQKSKARGRASTAPAVDTRRTPALIGAAVAVGLLFTAVPFHNLNWQAGDGSAYGFGYRSRAEIAVAAAYVRAHAASTAPVATPPIIAFAANRREVVPYAEVAGEMDELEAGVREDGWVRTWREAAAGRRTFWESVQASRDHMAPRLRDSVASHTAAVVIDDSPDDLFPMPMVDFEQGALEAAGYRLGAVWAHYEAWVAPPAPPDGTDRAP